MRPTQDLAFRARNWFWYWMVRKISGLSNAGLDGKCFGSHGRRRHFERLEASASNPDQMPLVNGMTLLELVDAWDRPEDGGRGPFARATDAFRSNLWSFLATRDQPPAVYTDFIQQYAEARGWLRISYRDYALYSMFLGTEEPAIEHGVETAYSAMLHKIVSESSPDAVAVLIALFREALNNVQLENAIAIQKVVRRSIALMGEELGIPAQVTKLIMKLTSDRVLSNRWITEDDWRSLTNTPVTPKLDTRGRIGEFKAWVTWYTNKSKVVNGDIYGGFPLVPRSLRTDWLEEHRDFLEHVLTEVYALQHTHQMFRDSLVPENKAMAEQAQFHAKGLLAHINPPDVEPETFYSARPNYEMDGLPSPFRPHGVSPSSD